MPILVIKNPDGTEEQKQWAGQLTIGGADGNDLVLKAAGISARHAKLSEASGGVVIEDAGSESGTFVDGQRIAQKTPLKPSSAVNLGKVQLQLRPDAAGAAIAPRPTRAIPRVRPGGQLPPRRSPASASPGVSAQKAGPPTLRGLEGPTANQRFVVRGKMTVGRLPGSEILVDDDSVSRRHAEVELVGGKTIVRDLASANGTTVNGERLQGEIVLNPGDIVGFGVVDFELEISGNALAKSAPVVPIAPVVKAPVSTRKKLFMGVGALFTLLFLAGLFRVFTAPSRPDDQGLGTAADSTQREPSERLIARCRSFADSEGGGEPSWFQARRFCEEVRNRDPINEEANALLKRIDQELANKDLYDRGRKLLERDRGEEAIDWFKRLPKESWYFSPARVKVDDIRNDLVKRASNDCRTYVEGNHYPQAIPRCERYLELVCQDMSAEELQPPAGAKVDLTRGTLAEGSWRPRDTVYLDYLRAREKVMPKAPPWQCIANDMLKFDMTSSGAGAQLEAMVKSRYPEGVLRHAVFLYFQGKQSEAETALFKVRDDLRLARLHEAAEALRKDIDSVHQLYTAGQSELQVEDPESASEPFQEALELDEKVMGTDSIQVNPSWYRRNIQQDMAAYAYKRGKSLAQQRGDRKKGCQAWKLGWRFYKGNPELARAIQVCTDWASRAGLDSCDQVEETLTFAVEGDGYREKAEAKKQELHCP